MKNRLGLAITSFVLGLVGFLTLVLAGIGLLIHLPGYGQTVLLISAAALLIGLVSMILGLTGKRTSSGKGLAVAGASLGSITMMMTLLLMVVGYLFDADISQEINALLPQQEPAQQVQAKQPDKPAQERPRPGKGMQPESYASELRDQPQRFSVPLLDAKLNEQEPNQLWVMVDAAYPDLKLAALGKEIGRDYQERCAMVNVNVVIADGAGPRVEISVKEGKLIANAFAL